MRCSACVSFDSTGAPAGIPGARVYHRSTQSGVPGWRTWLLTLCLLAPAAFAQEPVPNEVRQFTEEAMRQAEAQALAEAAAQDCVGGKWRGVSRIRGLATISYRTKVEEGHMMPSEVTKRDEEATVRFLLVRDDTHFSAGLLWRAQEVSLAGGGATRQSYNDGGQVMSMTEDSEFRGAAESPGEMTLDLDTESGAWQLGAPGHTLEPYTVSLHWIGQRYENMQWVGVNETETEPDRRVQSHHFTGTIAERPGPTVATVLD